MKEKIQKILRFIKKDVWHLPVDQLPKQKSFLITQLRILLLAIRGYQEDKIMLRASALTFFTLLSIVPIVAMIFGIAKGFGFEKTMEEQLIQNFKGQQEVLNYIISFANSMLENTKGGLIAGIGLVILFWSVMKVLGNIEESFNGIWQIKKARTFIRKISDYLSIMLISPILIILSSSATLFISTQLEKISGGMPLSDIIGPVVSIGIKFIPYILMWLMFTLLYMVMPNTKVNFKSALIAGIIAGSIFQLTQFFYIHFQVGMSKYNAIYGSFAAFPLFIVWLQLSWLIILVGAEISFANQNVTQYEFESGTLNVSNKQKMLVALTITHMIIKNFEDNGEPLTASTLSKNLQTPIRLIRQLLYNLTESNIICEVTTESKERSYHPATVITKLTIGYVMAALDSYGSEELHITPTEEFSKVSQHISNITKSIAGSESNVPLSQI